MNMIRHAARGQKDAFLGAEDATDVFVESGLEVGRNRGHAIFGAENQVVMETRERLRHGGPRGFLSPLRGFWLPSAGIPAVDTAG
jgi:hypothetical protein